MTSKLSVVICTYNRAKRLDKCLTALEKQTFANFEVIIVDGGSTDETEKIIKKHSKKLRIKKIIERKKELSQVRDKGWRESEGKYVSWIDDDVVVSPEWAETVVKILDENENIAGVTGPTLVKKSILKNRDVFFFYQKKGFAGFTGKMWERLFIEGDKYQVGRIFKSGAWSPGSNFQQSLKLKGLVDVDYLEACNMTLRRKLIKKVDGYDYGYTGIAEWCELDLAMRIKKLGYRLVFSLKVIVHHNISQGGVYSRRTGAKQRMENFFKFYFRHIYKPCPSYIFKFTLYLFFLNGYWLYKAISDKNLNWIGGWIGTITGLKYVTKK